MLSISQVFKIKYKYFLEMALPSISQIDLTASCSSEEMPSKRKSNLKQNRKRIRHSGSDDEFNSQEPDNRPQIRMKELLKTYEERVLTDDNDKLLRYVPDSVKGLFISYMKHMRTIKNNFKLINTLLGNNEKLLKPELTNKFQNIVKNVENKLGNFNDDLIDQLVTNFDRDPVYESIKAACVEPIIKLDKIRDYELSKNTTTFQKEDICEDFIDSDIDLQISEVCDNVLNEIKTKPSEPENTTEFKISNNTYFKKKNLDPIQTQDGLKNLQFDGDHLIIYTDGCCLSNGRNGAQAGIGVWFNHNHPLNMGLPVKGPATNNNAEIQAATKAILTASSLNIKKVMIYTDSMFLINCMTTWIGRWKKNNWRTADRAPVKNRESLQELDSIISLMESVKWNYVPGHKGDIGNEAADALAKEGAKQYEAKK